MRAGNSSGSNEAAPRLFALDVMRLVASTAVISVHVTAPVVNSYGLIPASHWWVANLVDSAFRWAVPLFIMLSGFLLLTPRKPESTKSFLGKRARRIVAPLLFWPVFYMGWTILHSERPIGWSEVINRFISGQTYYHTYFLYLIAGLYLITPPLRVFLRGATRKDSLYAIALVLSCSSAYAMLRCWAKTGRTNTFGIPAFLAFLPYTGYYLAGSLLASWQPPPRLVPYARAGLVMTIAATATGTALALERYGMNWRGLIFYHHLAPNVIFMTFCVWALCGPAFTSRWSVAAVADSPLFRSWADGTLGIFLIHPAVLDLLASAGLRGRWLHPAIGIPATVVAALSISLALVTCLRRLPFLRRLV